MYEDEHQGRINRMFEKRRVIAQNQRLERIATAVLAGLASVPNSSLQLTPEDVRRLDVESAIKYAKALIAELDKPA